jgi:Domain of unknown function (DUF4398)
MTYHSFSRQLQGPLQAFALALMCVGMAGCAVAPVQEMSNARQAIKAARDAGAERVAPQKLSEAQALLEQAEANLQNRSYRDARRNAVAAHGRAVEAMDAVHPGDGRS